jgi:membrane AbrB-like protein
MERPKSKELSQGILLLLIGSVGAWLAQAGGIPAGVIVGALLASGLYRLLGGEAGPWRGRYGRIGRVLLGIVIGAAFGPDVLTPLKTALLPMLGLITIFAAIGLGLGWALSRFTPVDAATALISSVPGGLPAMVAFADEADADATVVAAIHFARLTTVLLLMPVLIPLLTPDAGGTMALAAGTEPVGALRTVLVLCAGLAGAGLALRLGLPTGDLIGPILLVGGVNLLGFGPNPLADGFGTAATLLIGTAVGTQISRESLALLRRVALPAAALITGLISVGLALGWGLSQVTSVDLASALLSGVPGGASTMPVVAQELGGDMRLVAALHLIRQLIVFLLLPPVLSHIIRDRRHQPSGSRISVG